MFFVKIYRFFKTRKPLLYTLMVLSSVVFIYFGLKVKYQEDLSQLLPSTESSDSGLVFGNLKVKDKIFVQMTGAEPEIMAGYVDELMDSILLDTTGIANTLYRLDADMAISALDYALMHIPSLVDTSMYARFDEAIAHADETMARNEDLIMTDETGSITEMVSTDPLNLRECLMPNLSGGMGFTLVDGHLFSHDSTVALMFISPAFKSFDSDAATHLIRRIERRMAEFSASHNDVQLYMHGAPVRSVGNSHTMRRDIALTIGISLIIILIVLCFSFKSFRIIWQNVLPVFYGTFFAMACMYWLKGGMSLMALGIGSVILGAGLSYCLHIIIHQRFVGSIEKMLSDEAVPVCLGCLTTIGAFLGLLFTKSELLQDFGLFATFALIGCTFFALIFLPHLLKEDDTTRHEAIFKIVDKVNKFPYDKSPWIITPLVIAILVGIIMTPKVQFDNNLKHIGYESDNLLKSEALYAEKNVQGDMQRYYAVAAPDLDAALEANQLLSHVLDSLHQAKELNSYMPVVSMLFQSEKEQEMRIAKWKEYWTPEKINEAEEAIYRAARKYQIDPSTFAPFRAMVEMDYEPGYLYEADIIPEGLLCNFIEESEGKYMIFNAVQLDNDKKDAIDQRIAALPHAVVVDPFYYTGNMISLIHSDFNTTLLISSIFVLIVLLVSFRNILIALIAFMPMFLSWYVVQGWMAVFGLPFNLINIVISTFIFGIGVDYSIFVMQGLIAEARQTDTQLLNYHKAAVFFSAFVLLVVILSMMFATHPAIRSIGVSTLIGMASTILITYSLQPLFFRWAMKLPWMRKRVES